MPCVCGSRKKPSLDFPGTTIARYCGKCKLEGMRRVKTLCSCGSRPSFGLPGKRAKCCAGCKTPDMINVKHKLCYCGKHPSYGLPGKRAECCMECKTDDMINVKDKHCPCGKQCVYGLPGKRAKCCAGCKTPDMINVKHKLCPGYNGVNCPVMTLLQNSQKYCIICDPDDTRRKKRKIDEEEFFSFIENNGIQVTQREYIIEYRCIKTSRSRSFIDGIIISKDIVVCLEVDEEAHQHYDPICEEARLNDASAELRLQYTNHCISWVRINPNILTKGGKRDRTSKGCKVRNERHQEALGVIISLIENPIDCIQYVGY